MQLTSMRLRLRQLRLLLLLLLLSRLHAAALPASNALSVAAQELGYVELKPNGTLILRQVPDESPDNLQSFVMLRGVLQALKLQPGGEQAKLSIKMYGDGVEHKFPPLLEKIIQRIQTFFSIYRYTDTSRPVRKDELTTTRAPPPIVASTQKPAQPATVVAAPQKEPEANETSSEQEPGWITVGEHE